MGKIGLVNYPKFPSDSKKITVEAVNLAEHLLLSCCQETALVVTPQHTLWLKRPEESK